MRGTCEETEGDRQKVLEQNETDGRKVGVQVLLAPPFPDSC